MNTFKENFSAFLFQDRTLDSDQVLDSYVENDDSTFEVRERKNERRNKPRLNSGRRQIDLIMYM